MYKAIQKKACDLVMPDFMRIGGVTGWMRASAIAGAAGVPISTHLYTEVALTSCAPQRRRIGWSGRIGPIRSLKGHMRYGMACYGFQMYLASGWNGTRKPWRPILLVSSRTTLELRHQVSASA